MRLRADPHRSQITHHTTHLADYYTPVRERVEPAHLGGRWFGADGPPSPPPSPRDLQRCLKVRQVRHRAPPRYTKCARGRTRTDHRSRPCEVTQKEAHGGASFCSPALRSKALAPRRPATARQDDEARRPLSGGWRAKRGASVRLFLLELHRDVYELCCLTKPLRIGSFHDQFRYSPET